MKTLTSFFLIIFATGYTFSGEVNNGAGLAEKNFHFAYQTLEKNLKLCLDTKSCRLTDSERWLLKQIFQHLTEEKSNQKQLQFLSEKKKPGFFIIDNEVKIAKTGDSIASPIYINLDLLYSKNGFGVYEALSVLDATAILVHEMGHHHGVEDHSALDLLGAKVALFLQKSIFTTPLLPFTDSVAVRVINTNNTHGSPTVLINASSHVIDVSRSIRAVLHCPAFSLPISIPGDSPYGANLHNLHWERASKAEGVYHFKAQGNLTLFCKKSDNLRTGNRDYKLNIRFQLRKRNKKWVFVKNSITVQQTKDSWLGLGILGL